VTFTVGYTLGVSSPGGNAITDFATALLNFNLGDGDANSGGSMSDQLASFSQFAGLGSKSGTFTLAVSLGADETGFYTLSGNAESFSIAAIPEPGEWALMGGGLFAMAAFCGGGGRWHPCDSKVGQRRPWPARTSAFCTDLVPGFHAAGRAGLHGRSRLTCAARFIYSVGDETKRRSIQQNMAKLPLSRRSDADAPPT
jgi:hypothetical protein